MPFLSAYTPNELGLLEMMRRITSKHTLPKHLSLARVLHFEPSKQGALPLPICAGPNFRLTFADSKDFTLVSEFEDAEPTYKTWKMRLALALGACMVATQVW